VDTIGRSGLDRENTCTLQLSGRFLFYSITVDGGSVFFHVCPMDDGSPLERLVSVSDTRDGWNTISRLLEALENSGVAKLQPRPLVLGEVGPNCIVIG
jgi:hypothetical protein